VPVTVEFETTYSPNLTDNEIVTEILEIFDEAYPTSYTPPTTYDIYVKTLGELQSAVQDNVNEGKVIAVESGDYTGGFIHITVPNIKVFSLHGPAATILHGVSISANGVRVSGFTIKPAVIMGEVPCVYLDSSLNGVEISFNELVGAGGPRDRGVITTTDGFYSNVHIAHNKIHDLITGIYINPHTGIISIHHNEIYNCAAGVGGATRAIIEYNTFYNNYNPWSDWYEAIGADDSAQDLTIRYNNFLGDDSVAMYGTIQITAENNWWDFDGIDTHGNVNASYMIKTDFTLQPYEIDWFCIRYKFALDIYPYAYTITTTVKPAP
jgi:hypothetical protein